LAGRPLVSIALCVARFAAGQVPTALQPDDALIERVPFNPPPAPTDTEQSKVLAAAREIALSYTANLPNFVCSERITRYVAPPGAPRWISHDTLTLEVGYSRKGETYKLVAIDDKPTKKKMDKTGGFHSSGEFGSLLASTFRPESRTHFTWERWTTIRNRMVFVFSYRIDQPYSRYAIDLRNRSKRYQGVTGVKGLVYIDRQTAQVLRLTAEADDLPPKWPAMRTPAVLDYDFVEIAGQRYLLPKTLDSKVLLPDENSRNLVEFQNYRKFGSDVTLTFEKEP
jgi:hypothetical protein